ncbi:hypothetical protein J1N35_025789 [Gossypium stocksii]|uniref:ADP/ATP translocase n=1 Tax=Gossypium stocksii TaxID=47602 RepID=A0A9D3V8I0_9ROSI|nr:hypothetical protein J1N35_025789 [Gossypium stocksii]
MIGAYTNGGIHVALQPSRHSTRLAYMPTISPIFVQAPSEKGFTSFMVDFLMEGVSVAVSKTAAALIECLKILIQNQDEMIKVGRLSEPYKGITNCFARTIKDECVIALWRGNNANVLRYFPTQVDFVFSFFLLVFSFTFLESLLKCFFSFAFTKFSVISLGYLLSQHTSCWESRKRTEKLEAFEAHVTILLLRCAPSA